MLPVDKKLILDMNEEGLEEFTCGICLGVVVNPMDTPCCRKSYCNNCISQWLQTTKTCPNDRRPLISQELREPSRAIANFLSGVRIMCKYHFNGCETILKISEMDDHLKACPHNICEECGLGRASDQGHNCIANLKIRFESISAENQRLKTENRELNEENTKLKQNVSSDRSSGASHSTPLRASIPRTPRNPLTQNGETSNRLKTFINGKFIMISKYKLEAVSRQRVVSKAIDTTLDIISNGSNYILIRSQSDDTKTVKKFSLENPFQWRRADGKCLTVVFRQDNFSPDGYSRWIETIQDGGKATLYIYDFDIIRNELKIEWTIANITKVEIFSRQH